MPEKTVGRIELRGPVLIDAEDLASEIASREEAEIEFLLIEIFKALKSFNKSQCSKRVISVVLPTLMGV